MRAYAINPRNSQRDEKRAKIRQQQMKKDTQTIASLIRKFNEQNKDVDLQQCGGRAYIVNVIPKRTSYKVGRLVYSNSTGGFKLYLDNGLSFYELNETATKDVSYETKEALRKLKKILESDFYNEVR